MLKIPSVSIAMFFTLSFKLANSQSGIFCSDEFLSQLCIEFLPENKFHYSELMCMAQIEGKGTYTIFNDTLILNFEADTITNAYSVRKTDTMPNEIIFNISAIDAKSSDKISHLQIQNMLTFQDFESISINKNGISTFKTEVDSSLFYTVSSPGYEFINIVIETPGVYEVKLKLHKSSRSGYETKTGIERYKIVSKREDQIKLTNSFTYPYILELLKN